MRRVYANKEKFFITADEVQEEMKCSKSYAYGIIRKLNQKILAKDEDYIFMAGKTNRAYFYKCMHKDFT